MTRREIRAGRARYRPLGLWDRIPGGVRGALIMMPLMIVFYLVNTLGATLVVTGLSAGLLCYPLQMLLYGLTGFVSGAQARSSHQKAIRYTGRADERVRKTHPNYIAQGALGGVVMGLFGALVYLTAGAAAASLLPLLSLLAPMTGSAGVLMVVVDFFVCVGMGILGALVYGRVGS